MRIDILTLFPRMFAGPFAESIVARAQERGLVSIAVHDLRAWTHDRHRTVDDAPFGGGPGMVLKPGPIFEAVDALRTPGADIILMTPNGERLHQRLVQELAGQAHLIFICGHYEGVDERVAEHLATRELSIGDYVLTGGELPAMVVVDAVIRLIPGVLGCADSAREEAHMEGLLEYPQYTRPAVYRGLEAPAVLRSGDHQEIARWRRVQSLVRTWRRRPDLLRPEHWEELRRLGLLDDSQAREIV